MAPGFSLCVMIVLAVLGGCSGPPVTVASPDSPARFEDAITIAADRSFMMPGDSGGGPLPFIIDPLIDGSTGAQSKATQYIQNRVIAIARAQHPRFQVHPFSPAELDRRPIVLIGTFNTVNTNNEMKGDRSAWWICLVLVDMRTGKVVARGVARAQLGGVDATPIEYFKDSPAWSEDDATSSYVKNCQKSKVGDLVDPKYLDGLLASSLIAQAIEAYDSGKYQQSLDLYKSAAAVPGGDQLRLYIGLYLTSRKLGDRPAEADAFRRLVDYGLAHRRLAVKFLFPPSSPVFVSDPKISGSFDMWLELIAHESASRDTCLAVTGHTTPTGLPPINDRLSLLRAEYVKDRLNRIEPRLAPRLIAVGAGSRENLVGTGKDDDSDLLDRRVEFKVVAGGC